MRDVIARVVRGLLPARRVENKILMTAGRGKALIVSNENEVFSGLQESLNRIGISADLARTCEHARTLLEQANPPELVFSDSNLPDGSWAGVIGMTTSSTDPVPIIVISKDRDYQTCMDAMDAGAADCIGPPFLAADVAWVVRNTLNREKSLPKRAA